MHSFILKQTSNTNGVCRSGMDPPYPSAWDAERPVCPQKALEGLDIDIRNKWALHPHENKEPYQATSKSLGPSPRVSWSEELPL